ncbi:MAG TPA: hypothetical protein VM433_13145 [Mycobacteriales bacterium]|nr:hypothetical protein [Mycobacteriales bacterium]
MKATLLLCDYAQVAGGKLTAVGAGWTFTSPVSSHAVGILLDVPWDKANVRLAWQLQLRDEDGQQVVQDGPGGPVPVQAGGEIEVGRPAGTPPGTPIPVAIALPVHGVVLLPSSRYVWEFAIDGETKDEWVLRFGTRPD